MMKMKHLFAASLAIFSLFSHAFAQINLTGNYKTEGFFFHPTSPRALSSNKSITDLGGGVYQVDLADLGGAPNNFKFTFQIDANNKLINWTPVGGTYPVPASGFMTADNPGNVVYTSTPGPGTAPYLQSTFNNTYDPINKIIYMHYGYGNGSTGQNGYTRQAYEQWTLIPNIKVSSFTPKTGTSGTPITIYGQNFHLIDSTVFEPSPVSFGGATADSLTVVNDSVIIAWVGNGASGAVYVHNGSNGDSVPGFTYINVPTATNSPWVNVGPAGFSTNAANYVNTVVSSDNTTYVAFQDTITKNPVALKYVAGSWVSLGSITTNPTVSIKLALDKNDIPYIAYFDVTKGGIIVQKYTGSAWQTVVTNPIAGKSTDDFSFALDNTNKPYVLAQDPGTKKNITLYSLSGSTWATVGAVGIGTSQYGSIDLAFDKTTNIPYVAFDDANTGALVPQVSVLRYYPTTGWENAGFQGITTGFNGAYYVNVAVSSTGKPYFSCQEDNGFERASVYNYTESDQTWNAVGSPLFSHSHTYYGTLALDKSDAPYFLYQDVSYNKQGTILKFNASTNNWDTIGARGFIPASSFARGALAIDTANAPLVAFSDNNNGLKVSVLKYVKNTLPLRLTAFKAYQQNSSVNLVWQTLNELGSDNFSVQRSLDGVNFENLVRVKAKESSVNNYQYADIKLPNATTVYYRLVIFDKNGSFTYSPVEKVNLSQSYTIKLYPVPVKNNLSFELQSAKQSTTTIQITDMSGKVVFSRQAKLAVGFNSFQINTASLAKGSYVFTMNGEQVYQKQIIKE